MIKRFVLLENLAVQRLELRPRLHAELLDEELACLAKRAERFDLAPGAIEREHVAGSEVFAIGVLVDERLGFQAAVDVVAELEASVESGQLRSRPERGQGRELAL